MQAFPDDQYIIDLFHQGRKSSDKAFRLLVDKYGEILYRQIRQITRNHEHTNDVLQDVFVKVYQNLEKFKGDSSLYTWLYRITRNESLNFIAKENRRSGVDLDAGVIEIIAGHQGLDNMNGEQISELLHQAIETLPEKQAIVFHLKYFEDMKYSEISAKLNTSEGALKASFFHAREKIQKYLISQLNQ